MKKTFRYAAAIVAFGVAAALLASVPASAVRMSNATNGKAVSAGKASLAEQRAGLKYWTKARMARAIPMDLLKVTAQEASRLPAGNSGVGKAINIKPSRGGALGGASVESQAHNNNIAYHYPPPFSRYTLYPTNAYTLYPHRTHGKVFFTQNGSNYVCSGTAVTSTGKWLVQTAGHCVSDGTSTFNSPIGNTVFVPAYLNNSRPFGTWSAFNLWTHSQWHFNGNFRYDVGYILVNNNSSGQKLQDVVGSEGIAFNSPPLAYFMGITDYGYPQAAPFNGQTQHICAASFAEYDPFMPGNTVSPRSWGIGCDMTGGSSGGGWVRQYRPPSGGYVVGVNSYKYTNPARPLEMFTPFFGNDAAAVYACATDNVC